MYTYIKYIYIYMCVCVYIPTDEEMKSFNKFL